MVHMSLYLDYLVLRRNMFVGSIAVNPQETKLLLLGTPRGLEACSIRSMLSCSLRKWLSLNFLFFRFLGFVFILVLLEDEQKIGLGVFDRSFIVYIFDPHSSNLLLVS